MRISTVTGLALAGAAVVTAIGVGGLAYAGDEPASTPIVRIVSDEPAPVTAYDTGDCPESGGAAEGPESGL